MTEQEWLTSTHPEAMLAFRSSQRETSDRKLRLFLCACCRERWKPFASTGAEAILQIAEGNAEADVSPRDRASSQYIVDERLQDQEGWLRAGFARPALIAAKVATIELLPLEYVRQALSRLTTEGPAMGRQELRGRLCHVIRDVLGPFGTAVRAFEVASVVQTLALAAYTECLPERTLDPSRLAVLADAVEESGVDAPDLLEHLRSAGPHYRGCWGIDLLTDRK